MGVLIFSHQRCGSTNLLKFMGEACGVPALDEPFNRKKLTDAFPTWRKEPPERLSGHFHSVLDEARIIKHIYGQQRPQIDALIAKLPSVRLIIFLYRQNVAAAALSTLIARRINAFHQRPTEELGIIPVDEIFTIAEEMRTKKEAALRLCQEAEKKLIVLPYEHIFPKSDFLRKRRVYSLLSDCRKYAGVGVVSVEVFKQTFSKYLSQDVKINSQDTYHLIENRAEIAANFPNIFADSRLARIMQAARIAFHAVPGMHRLK